jgi:branched-chain amino acid transport system permease protein
MSMGVAGLMLIGGYSSALFVKYCGLSFWTALPTSGLLVAFIAFGLGYPFFRLKGMYFAILTMLMGESVRMTSFYWTALTGGSAGLTGIPAPNPITIPGMITITFDSKFNYYYLMLVIVLVSLLIFYRLERSRLGSTIQTIKENDILAQSIGINVTLSKIIAFAVSSFFVAIAGALFGFYQQSLSSDAQSKFGIDTSVNVLIYTIVGGQTKFMGPIIGAFILTVIPEFGRGLREYSPILIGAVFIIVVLFLPKGIVGGFEDLLRWSSKAAAKFKARQFQ